MSLHETAKHLASRGRDEDTMLVHMTPTEVNSLQGLAMAHGGSLTINPDTGLPEAGFLKSLLPMIAGAALMMTGVGAPAAAMMVGGGSTGLGLAKGKSLGDALGSGLKAGLGAYGGASLAGGLSSAMGSAAGSATQSAAAPFTQNLAGAASKQFLPGVTAIPSAAPASSAGMLGKFGAGFANTARTGAPSMLQKAAPYIAGYGVLQGLSGMDRAQGIQVPDQPQMPPYKGPYVPTPRRAVYPGQRDPNDSSEFDYFPSMSNPVPGYQPMYAEGGVVGLHNGSFIIDARTVSELGNGSSNAGQELLARMGGVPIRGPGDGASDSIPATIGRTQEARVARDEVKFDPEAVKAMGGGNMKKGANKLYELMEKAHQARKQASRGEDTGLGALLRK